MQKRKIEHDNKHCDIRAATTYTLPANLYTLPIKFVNTQSFGYRESVIVTSIVWFVKATGTLRRYCNKRVRRLNARPLRRPSVATMRVHVAVWCLPQTHQ